jgi:hypothetical protein
VTIHTVVGEDQREFDLAQGPGQSAGGGVVAGDEQGHGALRICSSLWTASLGSVGGRVMNGVNNLAQTPRRTD